MKKFYIAAVLLGIGFFALSYFSLKPLIVDWVSQTKPHFTVGFLTYTATDEVVAEGFKKELNRLAQNGGFRVMYVGSFVVYSDDTLKRTARALLQSKPDLIVTSEAGIPYIRALDKNIPIISKLSASENDVLVTQGFDAHSDNTVFVATGGYLAAGDRLFYLHTLLPNLKTVLVPHQPIGTPGSNPTALKNLREEAAKLGITLVEKEFTNRKDLNVFLLSLKRGLVDAIYRFPDNFIAENFDVVYHIASQPGVDLPVVGPSRKSLSDGAVLSYGFNPFNLGQDAASVAYKILYKKVPPNSISTQHAYHFDLGINIPMAERLRITIPQTLLDQATTIIR